MDLDKDFKGLFIYIAVYVVFYHPLEVIEPFGSTNLRLLWFVKKFIDNLLGFSLFLNKRYYEANNIRNDVPVLYLLHRVLFFVYSTSRKEIIILNDSFCFFILFLIFLFCKRSFIRYYGIILRFDFERVGLKGDLIEIMDLSKKHAVIQMNQGLWVEMVYSLNVEVLWRIEKVLNSVKSTIYFESQNGVLNIIIIDD